MHRSRQRQLFAAVILLLVLCVYLWVRRDHLNTSPKRAQDVKQSEATAQKVEPKKIAIVAPPKIPPFKAAGGTAPRMATPLAKQPTLAQIQKITGLPARRAAEIKFDIPHILEAAQNGKAVDLELFPGSKFVLKPQAPYTQNGFQHIEGLLGTGLVSAEVTLTTDGDQIVVGIIQDPPRSYQIQYSGHGTSYVVEVDTSKVFRNYESESPETPVIPAAPSRTMKNPRKTSHLNHMLDLLMSQAMAASVQTSTSRALRVWMLYTPELVAANGGVPGTEAMIANQIAIANAAFVTAGANITLEVAKYDLRKEDDTLTTKFADTLDRVAADFRTAKAQTDLRAANADIVHLMRLTYGPDACGKAFLIDNFTESSTVPTWNRPYYMGFGFGVSSAICNYKYTLAHEIGHNLGLDHDPGNAVKNRIANQYNFGHRDNNAKTRTIMAYASSNNGNSTCGGDYVKADDPMTMYTDCPVLKAFSSNQKMAGQIADNARKLREVSDVTFMPPTTFNYGAGSSTLPTDMQTTMPIEVVVKEGATVPSLFKGETAPGGFVAGSSINFPSSYYEVLKNGTRTDLIYLDLANYTANLGVARALAKNDTWEIRVGSRFGYSNVRYHISDVHTPLVVGEITTAMTSVAAKKPVLLTQAMTGYPAATCKWSIDGVDTGSSGATYTTTFTPAEYSRTYTVSTNCSRVSAYGNESQTRTIAITAYNAPFFTLNLPAEQLAPVGGQVTLNVAAVAEPVTYTWYENGAATANTGATLTLKKTAPYTATWTVIAKNIGGDTTSLPCKVTFYPGPNITTQPKPTQSIATGSPVQLSVVATGSLLRYQWTKNDLALSGANAATLDLSPADVSKAGSYKVIVSNDAGSVTSNAAVLRIGDAPLVTAQPADQVLPTGGTISLSVTASGADPKTYQWYKDTTLLAGATAATYMKAKALTTDSAKYSVKITNEFGSVTSTAATVSVLDPPKITTQPKPMQIVAVGSPIQLSVVASGLLLKYQWYKGDVAVGGANAATLDLSPAAVAKQGTYKVIVSNDVGTVTSDPAVVRIGYAPVITTQPADQLLETGKTLSLSVAATGDDPKTYQWYKDAALLTGATMASYTKANAQPTDSGKYTVKVTNDFGNVTSNAAVVAVEDPPTITAFSTRKVILEGGALKLEVTNKGTPPFTYRWQRDGAQVAETTVPSYTVANLMRTGAGNYSVLVLNRIGQAQSAMATVEVQYPPAIQTQPVNISVSHGAPAALSVVADGNPLPTFQWTFNGKPIAGATAATYSISAIDWFQRGAYTVIVTNVHGNVTSATATINIGAIPIGSDPANPDRQPAAVVVGGMTLTGKLQSDGGLHADTTETKLETPK